MVLGSLASLVNWRTVPTNLRPHRPEAAHLSDAVRKS